MNLIPVLHKSKLAAKVARSRGPLRRPLQVPFDRRGRARERGGFRGRSDTFRCVRSHEIAPDSQQSLQTSEFFFSLLEQLMKIFILGFG